MLTFTGNPLKHDVDCVRGWGIPKQRGFLEVMEEMNFRCLAYGEANGSYRGWCRFYAGCFAFSADLKTWWVRSPHFRASNFKGLAIFRITDKDNAFHRMHRFQIFIWKRISPKSIKFYQKGLFLGFKRYIKGQCEHMKHNVQQIEVMKCETWDLFNLLELYIDGTALAFNPSWIKRGFAIHNKNFHH